MGTNDKHDANGYMGGHGGGDDDSDGDGNAARRNCGMLTSPMTSEH
jgi:hypothetical protein